MNESAVPSGLQYSKALWFLFSVPVFILCAALLPSLNVHLRGELVTQWRWTEVAAVAWALILNVYLYWTCPFIRHTDKEDRLMLSLLFGSVIAVLMAGIALFLWTPEMHWFCLIIGTLLVTAADAMLALKHDHRDVKRAFGATLLFVDLPMIVGFAGLTLFWICNANLAYGSKTKTEWEAFFCGVVSFQLFANNATFAAIQIGAMDKIAAEPHLREIFRAIGRPR